MRKLSYVLTMLVGIVLLASCSKQQSTNLIPEDALVVMRFDAAQLSDKGGLSGDKSEVVKWLKKQIKEADMDKALSKKLNDIIDDPSKSGIDITEPVFFYLAGDPSRDVNFGVVGTIASQGDLTSLLEAITDETGSDGVEDADGGVKYIENGGVAFIYTGDWFYFGKSSDIDDTIDELKERAGGKGSLEGNKALEMMCDKKGVAQMLILGEGLENIADAKDLVELLPDGAELKDIAVILDLEVEKGETVLAAEAVPFSDKWKRYIAEQDKLSKKIDKDLAKYISDRGFSMLGNVDTKGFKKYVEQMAVSMDIDDEEALDIMKKVIDASTGTFALDFYGVENNSPLVTAYVGSKDTGIIELIEQFVDEDDEDLKPNGDNEYLMALDYDYDYDWDTGEYTKTPKSWAALGYRKGQTYFSTDADNIFATPSKKYPTGDIKGKGVYVRFNFSMLNDLAAEMYGSDREIAETVAKAFDYVEGYSMDDSKFEMRLVSKNKKKTIFDIIADIAKSYLD